MTSAKSYARAYLDVTATHDVSEQLAWLMAFQDRGVQRTLTRILQRPDADAVLKTLDVPTPIARFLTILHQDRALKRLGTIAEQGLSLAVATQRGLPVRLITATAVPATTLDDLVSRLTTQASGPVVVASETDPRLLGGFRVAVGDQRVDQTLATRVAGLRRALVNA